MEKLADIIERQFLPFVEKPVRYTGAELNIIRKDLKKINLHGVLCFPDLYDIGMSHFGLQILYHIVNKRDSWALSRCFTPWADAEKLMREMQIPLYTLEYFSAVREADWVGFSVQYELQFTNLINMLDLSGISVFGKDRSEDEPVIIAGGPCVGNPEPLAHFVDAFALGDGEQTVVNICTVLESAKREGLSRNQKLEKLSEIPGVYVPSLFNTRKNGDFLVPVDGHKVVTAAKIALLESENYPQKPVVPLIEVVHSRLSVEVMRGCSRGCRFCSAGINYRPVRERAALDIINQIRSGIDATGWRDVGLLSLSTADYSCFSSLLEAAREIKKKKHISLGLPSTRIDALNDAQMDLYQTVTSTSSITIAPEAGSMRLRKVINKDFTDEMIYETVKRLLNRNVQTLKLYFMVGLPTESMDDIDAIVQMVTMISSMVKAKSKRREVHVAISPFSPKAHTPFGREPMVCTETLLERSIYIKRALRNLKNTKVSYRDPQITLLETVMARGDRSVGDLIYQAWKNGARFDGWDECFNFDRWISAAQNLEMNLNIYLQKLPSSMKLPWAAVSTGVSEQFLLQEAQRAFEQIPTGDCRNDGCKGCGVCNQQLKNILQSEKIHSQREDISEDPDLNKLVQQEAFSYRFSYKKSGALRFLGHMDMVSLIHRAFLMSGVKLAYSNGFNPHVKISFGPPLPFAVIGEREAFDIVTVEPFDTDIKLVNSFLPEDIHITGFLKLTGNEPSLNSSIVSVLYHFELLSDNSVDEIKDRIRLLLARDHAEVTVEKKGEQKIKDIRPGIIELNINSGYRGFDALLSIQPPYSCKPSELVSMLFPELNFSDFLITRKNCFILSENTMLPL
ncbi:MAG TPA: TIGR03960 family B12-binding radical SAM protein [Chitinispirillaceae bacterium]|nr:TIGR03960 family B12-binding radical SAM protein [Chitinispirillaceae bacterium]